MPENKDLSHRQRSCRLLLDCPSTLTFPTDITSLRILWSNLNVIKFIYLLLNRLPPHPLQRDCTETGDGPNPEGKMPVAMCMVYANTVSDL